MKTNNQNIKKETLASKLSFVGGGAGLAVFAICGVLNASLIGGIVGINVAGALMGFPVESGLISRVIVATGMLMGVMVAGLIFTTLGATAGWAVGKVVDTIRGAAHNDKVAVTVKH